jgi:hypothetical protein
MKTLVSLVTLLVLSSIASAQTCVNGQCPTPVRSTVHVVTQPVVNTVEYFQEVQPVRTVVHSTAQGFSQGVGLAHQKSQQQASEGTMRHVGGGFGGGRYEGVGFSTSSPEAALRACCYRGQRPIRDQAVVYGYNRKLRCYGWFATTIYN